MSSSTEHPYLSPTSHERPDHSTISSACEVGKKWWWNCRHEFERSIKSTALAIFEVESESCWLGFLQAVPFGRMNTILLRTSNFSKHSITVFWTLLENLLLSTFWPQLATRCKAKYSSLLLSRFLVVCPNIKPTSLLRINVRTMTSRLQKKIQSPLIAMARQIGLAGAANYGHIRGTERESGWSRIYKLLWYGFVGYLKKEVPL